MTKILRGPAHGTFYTGKWRIELADSGKDSHVFYDDKEVGGVLEVHIHATQNQITHITIELLATEVKELDISSHKRDANVYTNG